MIWPVPGYYTVTSGYHDTRSYGLHGGFDIAAPAVPCVAVDNGIVIYTGWAGSAGRSVYIELEGGYRVHYCHLVCFNVTEGQAVAAGDLVGGVGGSGHGVDNYYGSHLHLNLFAAERPTTGPSHWVAWVGMWALDPELYLGQEEDDMPLTPEEEGRLALLEAFMAAHVTLIRDASTSAAFLIQGKTHRIILPDVWDAMGRDLAEIVTVPHSYIMAIAPEPGPAVTLEEVQGSAEPHSHEATVTLT